jgi:GNAT superfamily N-acetyltransferase
MEDLVIRTNEKESDNETQVFDIVYHGKTIGSLQLRVVKLQWPIIKLLTFLNDAHIAGMCRGIDSQFKINYFWLELLWLEERYRNKGLAVRALNIALGLMPAYSVLAGYAYKVAETDINKIIKFYRRNNFHICRNTQGNEGNPIIFTFVCNK